MSNLNHYQFQSLLDGASGSINCVLFSSNGAILLAGGGDTEVRVWNTLTSKPEGVLSNSGKWGQVTFLAWIFIDKPIDNKRVALAVGTGRGNLTLCPLVHGRPTMSQSRTFNIFQFNDAVEAMSFDRTNCRLAASSHSGPVKVFNVDSNLGLRLLWSNKVDGAIPRAIFFHGANNSLVMTLALETGELCCREADGGSELWAKTLEGAVGNAALSSDQSTLMIDNLSNQCFDIYTIPSCSRKTAPLVFSSTLRFPKQCTFSDGAQVSICGSTTNKIYVVDVTSSDIIQTLVAGDEHAMLQAVAATPGNRSSAFIAAGSTTGDVFLWKRTEDEGDEAAPAVSSISVAHPHPKDAGTSVGDNVDGVQSTLYICIAFLLLYILFPRLPYTITAGIHFCLQYLRDVPE